jgi:NADP-dependent 3-hydroxy acid dehydrogenase YdfG
MPRFPAHPDRRAAVVTGASSGHGLAIAQALADAGHPVVLGARRLDRLEETAAKIVADGGEAIGLPLDLTDDATIDAFALAAEERLGPIEIVVSNAGEVFPATALGVDPDEFHRQMQVNVVGAHRLEGLARAMQMELEGTGVRVGIVRPGPSSTEQGTTWSESVVNEVVADWDRWGALRHSGALRGQDVARAVLTVVSTPRGTHLTLVEVEPEAPVGGTA